LFLAFFPFASCLLSLSVEKQTSSWWQQQRCTKKKRKKKERKNCAQIQEGNNYKQTKIFFKNNFKEKKVKRLLRAKKSTKTNIEPSLFFFKGKKVKSFKSQKEKKKKKGKTAIRKGER